MSSGLEGQAYALEQRFNKCLFAGLHRQAFGHARDVPPDTMCGRLHFGKTALGCTLQMRACCRVSVEEGKRSYQSWLGPSNKPKPSYSNSFPFRLIVAFLFLRPVFWH